MLAAARSVIREVRGQCAARPARRGRRTADVEETADESESDESAGIDSDGGHGADDSSDEAEDADGGSGDDDYTDGSDRGQRRLSKAERKRLRKLARMNGTAA